MYQCVLSLNLKKKKKMKSYSSQLFRAVFNTYLVTLCTNSTYFPLHIQSNVLKRNKKKNLTRNTECAAIIDSRGNEHETLVPLANR